MDYYKPEIEILLELRENTRKTNLRNDKKDMASLFTLETLGF